MPVAAAGPRRPRPGPPDARRAGRARARRRSALPLEARVARLEAEVAQLRAELRALYGRS